MTVRYNVASSPSGFDTTEAWSYKSGGPPGSTVPDADSTVFFDGPSSTCFIDASVNVARLILEPNYTGYLVHQDWPLSVIGDARLDGGWYTGHQSRLDVTGNLTINGTDFLSYDQTVSVGADFRHQDSVTNVSTLIMDSVSVAADDMTAKSLMLADAPDGTNLSLLLEGTPQVQGVDYVAEGFLIKWDGLGMDGTIVAGDNISATYYNRKAGEIVQSGSELRMWFKDNTFSSESGQFHRVEFLQESDQTRSLSVGGDSTVHEDLRLWTGYFGSNGTLNLKGNVTGQGFGTVDQGAVHMVMDASAPQDIFNFGDFILPSLTVDKTTTGHVRIVGGLVLGISGDFNVLDGTFATNGCKVHVGAV